MRSSHASLSSLRRSVSCYLCMSISPGFNYQMNNPDWLSSHWVKIERCRTQFQEIFIAAHF